MYSELISRLPGKRQSFWIELVKGSLLVILLNMGLILVVLYLAINNIHEENHWCLWYEITISPDITLLLTQIMETAAM